MNLADIIPIIEAQGHTLTTWCEGKGFKRDTVDAILRGDRQPRGRIGGQIYRAIVQEIQSWHK